MIILFFAFSFLFAKEVVITKYLEDKPVIAIEFKGDKTSQKILDLDLKVSSHFEYTINKNRNAYYKFYFFMGKKNLRVKYFENEKLRKVKNYYVNNEKMYPFLIHKAVVDINNYFKLPKIDFMLKKIVFSILEKPREANIYIADYTLSYKEKVVKGGLNIFPKWIDNRQKSILYTYLGRKAILYKLNLITHRKKRLLSSEGVLIASDVKGNKVLLTMAPKGQTDIYEYNLKSKRLRKITFYPGIDVSGKFWKNDYVFISDRFGVPYLFEKRGSKVIKVMYHGKNQIGVDTYNNLLVVSTRESDKSFGANTFNLFLLNKNDDSLRRLTFSGQNFMPRFSQDGNTIMFISRKNFKPLMGIIRLNENRLFYFKLPKMIQSFDW
jgi:TolB protein